MSTTEEVHDLMRPLVEALLKGKGGAYTSVFDSLIPHFTSKRGTDYVALILFCRMVTFLRLERSEGFEKAYGALVPYRRAAEAKALHLTAESISRAVRRLVKQYRLWEVVTLEKHGFQTTRQGIRFTERALKLLCEAVSPVTPASSDECRQSHPTSDAGVIGRVTPESSPVLSASSQRAKHRPQRPEGRVSTSSSGGLTPPRPPEHAPEPDQEQDEEIITSRPKRFMQFVRTIFPDGEINPRISRRSDQLAHAYFAGHDTSALTVAYRLVVAVYTLGRPGYVAADGYRFECCKLARKDLDQFFQRMSTIRSDIHRADPLPSAPPDSQLCFIMSRTHQSLERFFEGEFDSAKFSKERDRQIRNGSLKL